MIQINENEKPNLIVTPWFDIISKYHYQEYAMKLFVVK